MDVRGSPVATCSGFGRCHDDSGGCADVAVASGVHGVGNPGSHDDVASSTVLCNYSTVLYSGDLEADGSGRRCVAID